MLKLLIKGQEMWNEEKEEFVAATRDQVLSLEHSLVSVSKWEEKYHKPFLSDKEKTKEELIYYIKCMTITQNVQPITYLGLSNENIRQVTEYIQDSMTATWFSKEEKTPGKKTSEQITSELIYYWMISLNIPFECQKWHLNRLLTLIRICNVKNQPAKKHNQGSILRNNAALNAARRKKFHSAG